MLPERKDFTDNTIGKTMNLVLNNCQKAYAGSSNREVRSNMRSVSPSKKLSTPPPERSLTSGTSNHNGVSVLVAELNLLNGNCMTWTFIEDRSSNHLINFPSKVQFIKVSICTICL
jgi:hypothetical protein